MQRGCSSLPHFDAFGTLAAAMKREHFDRYLADGYRLEAAEVSGEEIVEGRLISMGNSEVVPIRGAIPRFVAGDNYAANFGLQWNRFKSTQLDSRSGLPLTANRLWKNTRWSPEELAGKTVLEAGSGAGRFTEILLGAGARVVSFDYSNAVEANFENNRQKGDLFLFQGDIYRLDWPNDYFDYVFCYGVLQHTPDPIAAYQSIFRTLKPGGKISIDYYRKRRVPTPTSTPKYLWRPITTKMAPEKLLRIVQSYIPWYLPLDSCLRRIPIIGRLIVALIPVPCWNYIGLGLSKQQRLEWAIMDTFDALGAAYDRPMTLGEVRQMVDSGSHREVEVFYGSNGVVANVVKA